MYVPLKVHTASTMTLLVSLLTATPAVSQLSRNSSRYTSNQLKENPLAAGFFLRSQFLLFAIPSSGLGFLACRLLDFLMSMVYTYAIQPTRGLKMSVSTIATSLVNSIHHAEHRFADRITTAETKDFHVQNATRKAFAQASDMDALFEEFVAQLEAHEVKCPFCGKA
jgi:hypothetical protein